MPYRPVYLEPKMPTGGREPRPQGYYRRATRRRSVDSRINQMRMDEP